MPRRAKFSHRQIININSHMRKENKQRELEEFGLLYFKYTKLTEDHAMVLRQDMKESDAAHARVLAETLKEQEGNPPASSRSPEQIQLDLKELARRCEIEPRSFDDRWRICFSSMAYVRTMMDCVVALPNRPFSDLVAVITIGSRLITEHYAKNPSQTRARRVNLIPKEPVTRKVTRQEVKRWRANPEDLVGKGFVTMKRQAFVVSDFATKKVKGAQYDVLYEDHGLNVFDLDALLKLVADCELV
ncbi:hypothetical protein M378DRAFT_161251, partial [Amanita muscaria Koide BX008]